ncbi:Metal-dependent hydrolase, endonuclease/exonuclease/phosphatase family [Micromonospora purpureochromogenes]|uniref:Metal-dependent hydrolase, endonuclease/exonuclease/phosphatase family n=1 Tax=Micromonospora purpureochromogenes TaxID=47872 RepID=A0A1C5A423_9ACTN|nr:endonuclease/exonuclease/phosphatase family protein [Micromonospora purpureochromogenes]SCF39831.1 Metal-dependent hydrolase, endonuclease/exonuclease/phosphatase family [Micromonospora purpureochromogenes]
MRYRHRTTVVTALGLILLTDVLRVFLPSVITIFGQAASTPAELLGAFALGWFVLPLAVPTLVRRVGVRPVALVAAVVLAGARLAVTGFPGGRAQLWLATAGLVAGLCWLTAVAAGSNRPVPGLALGLAAAAVLHTVSDTYRSPWLGGVEVWVVGVVLAALFLAGQALPALPAPPAGVGGARAWLLAGPALLLAGMVALSPAVARTAMSYQFGLLGSSPAQGSGAAVAPLFGPLPVAAAVGGFLLAALTPPRRPVGRWIGPVALLAGAVLVALGRGELLLPAVLLTAVGLGGCLARCDTAGAPESVRPAGPAAPAGGPAARAGQPATVSAGVSSATAETRVTPPTVPVGVAPAAGDPGVEPWAGGPGDGEASGSDRAAGRRGYATVGGMLVFAVAAVLYYAAYDLGYPNGWVPVAVAVLTAAVALSAAPVPALSAGPVPARTGPSLPPVRTAAWATALALVAALTADETLVAGNREGPPATVRVAAYNIRMGFGIEGRFDPDALARAVGRADVVVLSEVDRGWLLNGGHDTLDLLAERLDMPYVFAPAADPLWGDAVLSRWPLAAARTRRLPAMGAPTGAQALGVTVDLGADVRLAVVATHLQPPPGREPVVQARAVAAFALGYAAGRPLVVAGDLNTEPGAPGFAEFTRAGLVDALAAARPLPTSPADDPREQIDHVFVSPGLTGADVVAPRGTASDHLPVAVTLTLPPA